MHTVVEMPTYLSDVKSARLSIDERMEIVNILANNPMAGDEMAGTGGARKLRIAGRGKGKSGGYRVVTFYTGDDLPVFLLALISKGERANLSAAERNELKAELKGIATDYRMRKK